MVFNLCGLPWPIHLWQALMQVQLPAGKDLQEEAHLPVPENVCVDLSCSESPCALSRLLGTPPLPLPQTSRSQLSGAIPLAQDLAPSATYKGLPPKTLRITINQALMQHDSLPLSSGGTIHNPPMNSLNVSRTEPSSFHLYIHPSSKVSFIDQAETR